MAGIAALLLVLIAPSGPSEPLRWYFQPERALAAARRLHQPVMLDLADPSTFETNWYDNFLFVQPRLKAELTSSVVPLRLQLDDEGRAFAERFHLPRTPSLLFLNPDGQPYWRLVGRLPTDTFLSQLRRAVSLLPSVPHLLQVASSGTGTRDDLACAACVRTAAGQDADASDLLRKAGWGHGPASASMSEAALALADNYRARGLLPEAQSLLTTVASQPGSPYKARALYGMAMCFWRNGQSEPAVNALGRLASMGEQAGDYRFMSQRMMMRMAMMPHLPPFRR